MKKLNLISKKIGLVILSSALITGVGLSSNALVEKQQNIELSTRYTEETFAEKQNRLIALLEAKRSQYTLDIYFPEQIEDANDIIDQYIDNIQNPLEETVEFLDAMYNSAIGQLEFTINPKNTLIQNQQHKLYITYSEINKSLYRTEQKGELQKIYDEADAAIPLSTTHTQVKKIYDDAVVAWDAVPTLDEMLPFEKESAKKELDEYVNLEDYRQEEKEELEFLIPYAKRRIDLATEEETVAWLLMASKNSIDLIPTDAELTEEETGTSIA